MAPCVQATVGRIVRISAVGIALLAAGIAHAGTVVFFDDSNAYPRVSASATFGGTAEKVDEVPASVSVQGSDPIRGSTAASASVTRIFSEGLATGSVGAGATINGSGSASAGAIDEFKFTLDSRTSLTLSASVQKSVAAGFASFYLNQGGQFPVVIYSTMMNPPPSNEPRYTLTLEPGTYIFHTEAQQLQGGQSFSGHAIDYRLDFIPEPSVTILLAAYLPLGLLRHRTRARHRRTLGA